MAENQRNLKLSERKFKLPTYQTSRKGAPKAPPDFDDVAILVRVFSWFAYNNKEHYRFAPFNTFLERNEYGCLSFTETGFRIVLSQKGWRWYKSKMGDVFIDYDPVGDNVSDGIKIVKDMPHYMEVLSH